MTRRGSGRAPWALAGFAVVLVGLVIAGIVVERSIVAAPAGRVDGWDWAPPEAPAAGVPAPLSLRSPPAPGLSTPTSPESGSPVGSPPIGVASGDVRSPDPLPVAPASTASGDSAVAAGTARYLFPVSGTVTYVRTHHDYPATDIIATCGSPVRAVTDGVVVEVSRLDHYDARTDDGALRGGLFVSVLGDDGVRYYGSHLRALAPGVNAQVRVRAGEILGEVGASGDTSVCHLHFGLSAPCARVADWWVRRGTIWPWRYLDAWRRGEPVSPVAEITAWTKAHGCPGPPG